MPDRSRKPDRAGIYADENPPDLARDPASPSPIEPSQAERVSESADRPGATGLSPTLRELVQSLPPRPVVSPRRERDTTAHEIAGAALPAFDEHLATGPGARADESVREGDPTPSGPDRTGPFAAAGLESSTVPRGDGGGSDRREEVATIPTIAAPPWRPRRGAAWTTGLGSVARSDGRGGRHSGILGRSAGWGRDIWRMGRRDNAPRRARTHDGRRRRDRDRSGRRARGRPPKLGISAGSRGDRPDVGRCRHGDRDIAGERRGRADRARGPY